MLRKILLFTFFLVLLIGLFLLYQMNSTPINFKFYGGVDTHVRLVVVIAISFLVGMIIGWISTYPKRRQLKKTIRQLNKQMSSLKTSLVD